MESDMIANMWEIVHHNASDNGDVIMLIEWKVAGGSLE